MPILYRTARILGIICFFSLIFFSPSTTQSQTPSCTIGNWVPIAPSPYGFSEGVSVMVNNRLYLLSGFYDFIGGNIRATTNSFMYDPYTNAWTTLAPSPIAVTHTAFASDGDNIWVVGGFQGDAGGPAVTDVYIYNITTNTWTTSTPLPVARGAGALVRLGRNLHYFGGLLPDRSTNSPDHFVLDLDNPGAGWLPLAPLPQPRNHLAGIVHNGLIYAIGGQFFHDDPPPRDDTAFLHVYDPVTDTWTQLSDLLQPRSHHETSTFLYNDRIFVVGGTVSNNAVSTSIIEYDIATDTWFEREPLPVALSAMAAGVVDGRIIVTTGKIDWVRPQFNSWISSLDSCETTPIFIPNPIVNDVDLTYTGALTSGRAGNIGDQITWTVDVANHGNVREFFNIEVRLPDNVAFRSININGASFTQNGQIITVNVPPLDPNATFRFSIVTRIAGRAINGLITSVAQIQTRDNQAIAEVRVLPPVTALPQTGETPLIRTPFFVGLLLIILAFGGGIMYRLQKSS